MIRKSLSVSAFTAPEGMPSVFSIPELETLSLVRDLGYDGVDLFINDPCDEESRRARSALSAANLGIALVMPAALARQGLSLGDKDNSQRKKNIEKMHGIIDYASDCGAQVSLGLVRGSYGCSDTLDAFLERFADSADRLIGYASPRGVKLVIEPINRAEINNLNTSLEALDFIGRYKLDAGLLLDTYHMYLEKEDIPESFSRCIRQTWHIHLLGPDRNVPDPDSCDIGLIMSKLENYSGYLAIEALPVPSGMIVASRGRDFFEQTL